MGSSVTTLSERCTHWAQHCYLWGPHRPSPWPSLTAPRAPCPSPDQARTAATPETTTSSTSTAAATRSLTPSQPTLPRHPPTPRAPNLREHMLLLLGTLGTRDLFHILKSTTSWHDSTVKENHSSILFATDILHYMPLF